MRRLEILFTVDLSELSSQIVPHVERLRDIGNARIDVLFVVNSLNLNPGRYHIDDSLTEAKRDLRDFVKTNFEKSPSQADAVRGDPGEKILEHSAKERIDIIIVGGRPAADGQIAHSRMVRRLIRESAAHVWTFGADGGPLKELRLPE